ncbi:MAG: TonB-dependent receptor [Oceanicaulis sp.]|uniref:Ligand-gated channel protein n=1 Tax=Maricaulis virginensis TaxID=144022 RepID=A0A9W6MMW8_9PROT|nr:TonB-dependent receptor [Maricaulis virginensis]MAZ90653.1 TonB-dependent receptor [Maricaulis sp.]MBI75058.1 TonB-dependent receptor [Oceanicaulis sp.]GLK51269.1 ligand-gated channel protein [Maricaulis virginensis]
MKTVLLAGVAAFALSAPGLTQDADATNDDADVIVVEATYTKLDAFVYPGMTASIDAEALDLRRPADLDDLLRSMPGLDVAGGPRRTGQTIALRGQGRENTTLLLDGARQNYSSGHDGVFFIDPALLVGVEAVRGPASAIYGSGASGGVVSFRTASAHDLLDDGESWGYSLGAGYRSVDEETRGSASVYGRAGTADFLASVSARSSGDISLGSGNDLPADDESFSSLIKIGNDFGDGLRAELSWQSFSGDVTEPNNGQGNAGVDSLNALVDKDITADNLTLTAAIAPSTIDWLDLELTVYRNETGVDERETVSGRQLRRDLETVGIRGDQRFEFNLGAFEAGLTVGGEYYEDSQDGFDSSDPDGTRGGAPDADSQFTAGWVQLELDGPAPFGLPGRMIVLPGVRYDEFETSTPSSAAVSNDAVSQRLGLTYAPIDTFNVFVSWGEAFRAPSINELYLDGTHFSFPHPILGAPIFVSNDFIANPDLLPEETETLEIGVGVDLADRVGVDRLDLRASWYETDAENLIDLSVDFAFDGSCFAPPFLPCTAGTTQSSNVGSAELSGYEIQASFAEGPFSLDASLTGIDGKDAQSGDPIGSLAPARLFVDGRWSFDQYRLILGGRIEAAGEYDEPLDPAEHRAGYVVTDVYARWRPFAEHGLSLNAGVENLLDHDYDRVFAGVSEPGRSVRFDIGWTQSF